MQSPFGVLFQGSWPTTIIVMAMLIIQNHIYSPSKAACLPGPLVEFPKDGPHLNLAPQPYAHLVQKVYLLSENSPCYLLSDQKRLINANGLNKWVDKGAGEYLFLAKPFAFLLVLINSECVLAKIASQHGPRC